MLEFSEKIEEKKKTLDDFCHILSSRCHKILCAPIKNQFAHLARPSVIPEQAPTIHDSSSATASHYWPPSSTRCGCCLINVCSLRLHHFLIKRSLRRLLEDSSARIKKKKKVTWTALGSRPRSDCRGPRSDDPTSRRTTEMSAADATRDSEKCGVLAWLRPPLPLCQTRHNRPMFHRRLPTGTNDRP